jgi:hypothetical protein
MANWACRVRRSNFLDKALHIVHANENLLRHDGTTRVSPHVALAELNETGRNCSICSPVAD